MLCFVMWSDLGGYKRLVKSSIIIMLTRAYCEGVNLILCGQFQQARQIDHNYEFQFPAMATTSVL